MMDDGRSQLSRPIRLLRLIRWSAIGLVVLWGSVIAFDAVTGARIGGPPVQALIDQFFGPMQLNASVAAEQARTIQFNASPRALPPLQFASLTRKHLTANDFSGRFVLLNFWATWCVPCRREMPTLDRLEATLGGPAFIVVPVSIDRGNAAAVASSVKQFYASTKVTHLGIYVGPGDKAMQRLGIIGIPTTLLIDRHGQSVGRTVGAAVWDNPRMVALLRGVINKNKRALTK